MTTRAVADDTTAPAGIPGTRDAVETAIDLSKNSTEGTWEERARAACGRIARWVEQETSERVKDKKKPRK